MSATFLDLDPHTGAVETFDYDEGADTFSIGRRSLDLQPIIDRNKEDANLGDLAGGDMRLAARIPIDVAYLWLQRYGVRVWDNNHWPAVRRLLNDNEWRYLKCRHVIV